MEILETIRRVFIDVKTDRKDPDIHDAARLRAAAREALIKGHALEFLEEEEYHPSRLVKKTLKELAPIALHQRHLIDRSSWKRVKVKVLSKDDAYTGSGNIAGALAMMGIMDTLREGGEIDVPALRIILVKDEPKD